MPNRLVIMLVAASFASSCAKPAPSKPTTPVTTGDALPDNKATPNAPAEATEEDIEIETDDTATEAGLTREQISKTMQAKKHAVEACYEQELKKDPNLSGRIVIRFQIGIQGTVVSSTVSSSTMNNKIVEDCLAAVIKGLQFPRPKIDPTWVRYPFLFRTAG